MLFNNNNGSFGPSSWIAPPGLGTAPFMRGDYVPVYKMVNKNPTYSGVQYGGWFTDWVKKSKDEKIAECKADPTACGTKLADLSYKLRGEDCSKYNWDWRKKACKKKREELQADIDLLKGLIASGSLPLIPLLPAQSSSSSTVLPIASMPVIAVDSNGIDPKTVGFVALGVVALGLSAWMIQKRWF